MRCEEFQSRIVDYFGDGKDRPVEAEFRQHLDQCANCSREFEQLNAFWMELGDSPAPVHEGVEIRAALLAELKWRNNMRSALKALTMIAVFAGFAVAAGTLWKPGSPKPESPAPVTVVAHIRGVEGAPVQLVEYGDYECPPCYAHQYHVMIDRILEKHPGMIRYEFRHFPITTIHPNALTAAMAAEAAGSQGKFWEMHKLLMSSHEKWAKSAQSPEKFVELAKFLGLDTESFRKTLESPELQQTIMNEAAAAREAGINATPTFLLNGKKLDPPPTTLDEFDRQINDALLSTNSRRLKK